MKRAWSVLAVSLSVVSYGAVAKLGESNGFSGEIALNAAYASKTSNLSNTDDEFRTYTGEAQENSSALVLPLGNVQYTWGSRSNHQVFLGTSRADVAVGTLALETGYRYQFQDGTKWSLAILQPFLRGRYGAILTLKTKLEAPPMRKARPIVCRSITSPARYLASTLHMVNASWTQSCLALAQT